MEESNGSMGKFVYFEIASGLKQCVNPDIHGSDVLDLQIGCDGLPLIDSGYQTLWPFICKIHFNPDIYEPFAIGVYSGESKLNSVEAYLNSIINEVNRILANLCFVLVFMHLCCQGVMKRLLEALIKKS